MVPLQHIFPVSDCPSSIKYQTHPLFHQGKVYFIDSIGWLVIIFVNAIKVEYDLSIRKFMMILDKNTNHVKKSHYQQIKCLIIFNLCHRILFDE